MSNEHYLNYLRREHARLEGEIATETRRASPDQILLARLKKLKLAVKDQITQYEREHCQQAA